MEAVVLWIIMTVSVLIVPAFVSGVGIKGLGGA